MSTEMAVSCVVQAGHLAFSERPAFLFSVCGNGVIVTLRDRINCSAGMAHVVFPRLDSGVKPTNFHLDLALPALLRAMETMGSSDRRRLEAQILGGGHLDGVGKKRAEDCVKKAREWLKDKCVQIVSEDIGGVLGRKVIFNSANGETLVVKTERIRRMDWLPEWEYKAGVKRVPYARGG